jgi:hypothetical protein
MANPPPSVAVRNQKQIWIFCSEQNPHLFAFTRDGTASNLPDRYGPWQPSSRDAMQGTVSGAERDDSDALLAAIEARGFYLSRSDGNAW